MEELIHVLYLAIFAWAIGLYALWLRTREISLPEAIAIFERDLCQVQKSAADVLEKMDQAERGAASAAAFLADLEANL